MKSKEETAYEFITEYHQLIFFYLHKQLENSTDDPCSYHHIRNCYWNNVPEGTYSHNNGIKLIKDYLHRLENEICQIISQNSIAYWLHLLRRIACSLPECGDDRERGSVIGLVRAIFEASIQKYGINNPCSRTGFTNELKLGEILNGFLLKENFNKVIKSFTEDSKLNLTNLEKNKLKNYLNENYEFIIKFIAEKPQLVLTNFGITELEEFYQLERLIFEVWRSTANLRGLNKGASLVVKHNPGDVFEERNDILDISINIFDDRWESDFKAPFTAKGTFHPLKGKDNWPWLYIPTYNVEKLNPKEFIDAYYKIFRNTKIKIKNDLMTNFIWIPLNMLSYYNSNIYYSKEFERVNNVNFESVIVVFTALLIHVFDKWDNPSDLIKYWQRGYEGPYKKEDIFDIIRNYLPICLNYFDLKKEIIDLEKGFLFWTLTEEKKNNIDLVYPGPHSIFLPYGKDNFFIDYAWMGRRLFDLFWKCNIKNENFKGAALELLIQQQEKLALPTKPCKSFNGEEKQIDASFSKKNVLLIIECKVVGRSIAFDKGTKEAILFRKEKYDKAIKEVDEKANWLINEMKGTNFDITNYNKIIPIVITPYKEYIPYNKRKYWISDKIPRILTPIELDELLQEEELWKSEENAIIIDTDE